MRAGELRVGAFSESDLGGWKEKVFDGATVYSLEEEGGRVVLQARSEDSASALAKKQRINLAEFPYLNWSWRIDATPVSGDERTKSGDDYAARVYVIFDAGIFPWQIKAVNYVWANRMEKGTVWENAFAGKNAMMVAVRNHLDRPSMWLSEKRNVREDLKTLFGVDVDWIDGVAIMTDTDNSNGSAEARYGDIFFSAQ